MQSNHQLTCDCANYAKYKKFYDEALAYEKSLYWDFAEFLLVCSAVGIVLFFLLAFVRIRKGHSATPIEDSSSSSLKTRHHKAPTKKASESSSDVSSERDSISSSSSSDYPSSNSDSSLDSLRSADSSETHSYRRPSFVPNRRSFVKMMGTIKDLPQKVQDEVQMPSFGRRQSGNKMKRSQSTSQVPLDARPLETSVPPSAINVDPPVFTSPFANSDNLGPSTPIVEHISPITPSPAPARNPERYSAPAALESAQGIPITPSTPRRPSLNFAKSLHDISVSVGPRSPSMRFPPFPRRSSARSYLGVHVEDQEGENEV